MTGEKVAGMEQPSLSNALLTSCLPSASGLLVEKELMLLSNLKLFVSPPSLSPIVQDFSAWWWLVGGELLPDAHTKEHEVHENQDHSLSPTFHHIPPPPHPAAGLKLLHGTTFAWDVTMGFPNIPSPLTWDGD